MFSPVRHQNPICQRAGPSEFQNPMRERAGPSLPRDSSPAYSECPAIVPPLRGVGCPPFSPQPCNLAFRNLWRPPGVRHKPGRTVPAARIAAIATHSGAFPSGSGVRAIRTQRSFHVAAFRFGASFSARRISTGGHDRLGEQGGRATGQCGSPRRANRVSRLPSRQRAREPAALGSKRGAHFYGARADWTRAR